METMYETTRLTIDGAEIAQARDPDPVVKVPRSASKSSALTALVMAAALGGMNLALPAPPRPREVTDEDRARIARAQAKRARKAAARRGA